MNDDEDICLPCTLPTHYVRLRPGIFMKSDDVLYVVAQSLATREKELGHPTLDGPTSGDVLFAGNMLADFFDGTTPPNCIEAWRVLKELAEVSDKWVDPEVDPIGARAYEYYEYIEEVISALADVINKARPEQSVELQKWMDLRALAHCARRTVRREEQNPPMFPWVSNARLFIGTTVGSLLYKSEKLLRVFGRRMR